MKSCKKKKKKESEDGSPVLARIRPEGPIPGFPSPVAHENRTQAMLSG